MNNPATFFSARYRAVFAQKCSIIWCLFRQKTKKIRGCHGFPAVTVAGVLKKSDFFNTPFFKCIQRILSSRIRGRKIGFRCRGSVFFDGSCAGHGFLRSGCRIRRRPRGFKGVLIRDDTCSACGIIERTIYYLMFKRARVGVRIQKRVIMLCRKLLKFVKEFNGDSNVGRHSLDKVYLGFSVFREQDRATQR